MTMQTTKAHRNGPRRSRKSRGTSAAQPVQAEMFSVSDDGGALDHDAQGSRGSQTGRPAAGAGQGGALRHGVSFGSFARAKTHSGHSAPAFDRSVRPTGRAAVTDSLSRFGLRRLSDPRGAVAHSDESLPATSPAKSTRRVRAARSEGEELPPLIPFIVSGGRSRADARPASRFAVPTGAVVDTRVALDAGTVLELGSILEAPFGRDEGGSSSAHSASKLRSPREPAAFEMPSAPRSLRRMRRSRLTTRGHVAVMVLIATVIAGTSAVANATHPGAAPVAATQEVVVHPGDTVESIASRFASPSDRADLVALIRAANGLSGSTDTPLPAGDYLTVPAN